MAYFLIMVLGGTLLWLMRSYLAEEDNDYYRHSPGERAAHSIGLGSITAAAIWGMTALLVRNVRIDDHVKKVVVAEMDTYKLVETKSGDCIVIADDGKTAYEVEDLPSATSATATPSFVSIATRLIAGSVPSISASGWRITSTGSSLDTSSKRPPGLFLLQPRDAL